ncbi:MAG TPA: 7-cyano-7-deazaguanine synthase, partial [Firmicutes bacterium]|nr:7-cyano-7-deazaguanine synthase [Bacillota bacterium]
MCSETRVVVLFSGGVDSAVTAAVLARDGAEVHLLFVNYGQRAASGEERAARR